MSRSPPWHLGWRSPRRGRSSSLAAAGGVGALVLFLGAPRPRAPRLGAIAAALVLAGAAVGELRVHAIDGPAGRVRDGEAVDLRAHLLTAPRAGPFGSSAEIAVVGGRLHGARLLLRIARWAPLPASAEPGSELALEGRLSALGKRPGDEPGSFDFAAHLRRRGIAGELMLEHARLTGARRGGVAGLLDRARSRAERAVGAGMAPGHAALLRGMVLGQDERIGEGVREDFRASGLGTSARRVGPERDVARGAGAALPRACRCRAAACGWRCSPA